MNANSMCVSCFVSRQEKVIRDFSDEEKKSEYMHQVLKLMYEHGQTESAPWMAEQMNELYECFWGNLQDFTPIKQKYNQLLLAKEPEIECKIRSANDHIRECIKYVCAANYIDFSAVKDVNVDTFEKLLCKAERESVPIRMK